MADKSAILEKLQDLPAFQQLKAKWDEQDPKVRSALHIGFLGGGGLILLSLVISSLSSVSALRTEIDEKNGMIRKIQAAQDELRRIRSLTSGQGGADGGDWNSYFQSLAGTSGIAADAVTITERKAPPTKDTAPGISEETLVQLELKKVNVKQLIRFASRIEGGGRTAKIRSLQVDTQPDESGYLDAKVAVSGFTFTKSP